MSKYGGWLCGWLGEWVLQFHSFWGSFENVTRIPPLWSILRQYILTTTQIYKIYEDRIQNFPCWLHAKLPLCIFISVELTVWGKLYVDYEFGKYRVSIKQSEEVARVSRGSLEVNPKQWITRRQLTSAAAQSNNSIKTIRNIVEQQQEEWPAKWDLFKQSSIIEARASRLPGCLQFCWKALSNTMLPPNQRSNPLCPTIPPYPRTNSQIRSGFFGAKIHMV